MSGGRLLILDDDAAVGQTVQYIAESAGLQSRFTADPAEFFRSVEDWAPTHIALDLVMPEMDGVQVLTNLASRGCRARIIITSGVGSRVLDAAGRAAAEHGLDIAAVLSKPFSPSAFRNALVVPDGAIAAREPNAPSLMHADRVAPPAFEVTAQELERALRLGELFLVYQPKIECATGALSGVEALVRWRHPQHGIVTPDRFVPFAEAHGQIDALTERVLDVALAWYCDWRRGEATDAAGVTLSMNISARTLQDLQFVDRIDARCQAQGIEPSLLIFELTETSAMEDPVASLELLTRLRMKGFQLSIDDFGTGYSSMLQLVRLPFSEIKVDRSFVMTTTRSRESRTVVKSIIDLGHSLGLRATAEGVEDAATLGVLQEMGCDLAQGYHIARPMPPEDVPAWLAGRRGG